MESVLRITVFALSVLAFASLAAAGEVPLLDGHFFQGTIEEVTDDSLRIRANLKDGGTAIYLSRDDFNDAKAQTQALAKVAPDARGTHQIEQQVEDEEKCGQGTGSLTGDFYSRRVVYLGAMHRGTNCSRGRGR